MRREKNIKIVRLLFIIYCIVLFYVLFLYGARNGNQFHLKVFSKEHFEMTNLVPMKTILGFFDRLNQATININIVVRNLGANLLMFIPMGMALPVLFEKRFNSFWKTILFTVGLVFVIEVIQFLTFTGSADIDDLILNTISCAVGYGIIRIKAIRKMLNADN